MAIPVKGITKKSSKDIKNKFTLLSLSKESFRLYKLILQKNIIYGWYNHTGRCSIFIHIKPEKMEYPSIHRITE